MHSFTSCFVHCVWSTKNREPLLTPDLRDRLWPYLGGIAKQNQMKTLAIGGASDHVHVLLSLPATVSVAKAMQLLKGNSSKWLRETFPKMHSFAWQALVQNQKLFDFAPPASPVANGASSATVGLGVSPGFCERKGAAYTDIPRSLRLP